MRHYTQLFCLLLTSICLFTSCTKDVEMGQQNVDTSSLDWLLDAGKTTIFKSLNNNVPLQLTTNTRKTSYIASPDCNGNFPKETCYHYQMQQVFITANTPDNTFSVTYSIIRSIKNEQFYDRLEVAMFEDEKTFANMAIISWAENPSQLSEATGYTALHDNITLDGKTFQNVYQKIDIGGELYYNKDQGVVAFETGDGKLWVLQ